jgi:transcriptional/translational regulatory protein YebC/TACO1
LVTVTIKRNDTKDNIKATLSNESGPIDLTGATVRFLMSQRGTVKVDRPAQIQDAVNGIVWMVFDQGDTDQSGSFQAEFEVTFSDARIETFPNDSFILINIINDLG